MKSPPQRQPLCYNKLNRIQPLNRGIRKCLERTKGNSTHISSRMATGQRKAAQFTLSQGAALRRRALKTMQPPNKTSRPAKTTKLPPAGRASNSREPQPNQPTSQGDLKCLGGTMDNLTHISRMATSASKAAALLTLFRGAAPRRHAPNIRQSPNKTNQPTAKTKPPLR